MFETGCKTGLQNCLKLASRIGVVIQYSACDAQCQKTKVTLRLIRHPTTGRQV